MELFLLMSNREIYQGRLINVVLRDTVLPNGVPMTVEVVQHPGAAATVPLDDVGNVLLVNQYRPVVDKYLLELPAGRLENGEDPRDAAKRELREETGFDALQVEPLVTILAAPGYSDERVSIFLARQLVAADGRPDNQEVLSIVRIPFVDVWARVKNGDIRDSKTVVGLLFAERALRAT